MSVRKRRAAESVRPAVAPEVGVRGGWVLPLGIGIVWFSVALVPAVSGPGVAQIVAAGVVILACAVVLLEKRRLPDGAQQPVSLAFLAVGLLGAAASLAANPTVSFTGVWGARTAWTLFALAFAWFALGTYFGRAVELSGLVKAIAALGSISALTALLQLAGVAEGGTFWSDRLAGVFESSLSLGQVLVLAGFCALGWFAIARTLPDRVAAGIAVFLNGLGIVLAQSRGALLALLVAVAVLVVVAPDRVLPTAWMRTVGRWTVISASSAIVALIAAGTLAARAPWVMRLDDLLTGRLTLWRSAALAFADRPLFGRGPGQFSAYATWGVLPDGTFDSQIANDPHGVLLALLVGGGLLVTVAVVVAIVSAARALLARDVRTVPHALLIAGVAGWVASVQFTWMTPVGLLAASALTGALIGRPNPEGFAGSRRWMSAATIPTVAATAVLAGSLLLAPVSAELRWGRSAALPPDERSPIARELFETTGDPVYGGWLLAHAMETARRNPDAAEIILKDALIFAEELQSDTNWHVPLAQQDLSLRLMSFSRGLVSADAVDASLVRAREADPGTGFFDCLAAERMRTFGRLDLARAYALLALGKPRTEASEECLMRALAP